MIYSILGRLFPHGATLTTVPRRIVLVRHCCIGDVVMATAALTALRELFPRAHIAWAAGPWSARAIEQHPALDDILDIGADMPLKNPATMWRFVQRLRDGRYNMAVSLVRSPLMSLALYWAGIPLRAGLDSDGRGFAYNLRVPIDSDARQHESEIYLKVISAIAGRELHAHANLPVRAETQAAIRRRLHESEITAPFIVAHPGGGGNPGMQLPSKRYPPEKLADLLNRLGEATGAAVILLGGPGDADLVAELRQQLRVTAHSWVGALSFQEIGALAAEALFYIGNDTGLTHLAAASGARTVMMMGPTDPQRYAPYTSDHLALWKPVAVAARGVAEEQSLDWNWERDGFSVQEGVAQILAFLAR